MSSTASRRCSLATLHLYRASIHSYRLDTIFNVQMRELVVLLLLRRRTAPRIFNNNLFRQPRSLSRSPHSSTRNAKRLLTSRQHHHLSHLSCLRPRHIFSKVRHRLHLTQVATPTSSARCAAPQRTQSRPSRQSSPKPSLSSTKLRLAIRTTRMFTSPSSRFYRTTRQRRTRPPRLAKTSTTRSAGCSQIPQTSWMSLGHSCLRSRPQSQQAAGTPSLKSRAESLAHQARPPAQPNSSHKAPHRSARRGRRRKKLLVPRHRRCVHCVALTRPPADISTRNPSTRMPEIRRRRTSKSRVPPHRRQSHRALSHFRRCRLPRSPPSSSSKAITSRRNPTCNSLTPSSAILAIAPHTTNSSNCSIFSARTSSAFELSSTAPALSLATRATFFSNLRLSSVTRMTLRARAPMRHSL